MKLSKIDNDLDEAYAQGDATLEGAEFTIYNKSKESVMVNGKEIAVDGAALVITTNAEGTAVKDFDLTAYTEGNNTEISSEQLAGGWNVPEDAAGSEIPEEAKAAFGKAAEQFTGSDIQPLALLGTQVVAGTNYAFICKSTLTTQEPISGIQIVTVYADLEGNAKITNIATVDPADFNE